MTVDSGVAWFGWNQERHHVEVACQWSCGVDHSCCIVGSVQLQQQFGDAGNFPDVGGG